MSGGTPSGYAAGDKSALQAAGVSDKAIVAQSLAYTELMMKAMNGNCSNIQVLLNKYMNFCLQLDHDADPRLKEWIACVHARRGSRVAAPACRNARWRRADWSSRC